MIFMFMFVYFFVVNREGFRYDVNTSNMSGQIQKRHV